jgi:beta-glucosidase-like glycosyl hydrolase
MSLEEKVGQLFVYAAEGVFMNEASPEYRELVRQVHENKVGGLAWFDADVYATAHLNRRLQALAKTPLLIAADLEAGVGMRFEDTTYWPWAMAVGATGDPSLAERQGRIVAREARALGLNQIYAPVADVNSNPGNPVINVRSYGEDAREVARFVAAFVRGVEGEGVLATAKHFPGHGDTATDSHRSLPILDVPRERLEAVELLPFRAAIAAGVSSVMIAHVSLPGLDPTAAPPLRANAPRENPYTRDATEAAGEATVPASLSGAIIEGLLRRDLGFRGLVVADALDMGSIMNHYDPGEAAVRALLAGADLIPKSPDTNAAMAGVRRAVETGRIPMERLDRSVERILTAKARLAAPRPDDERIFRFVDRPEHRAVAEEIAARSLTLVREAPGALPLPREWRVVHLIVSDAGSSVGETLDRGLATRLAFPPETFVLDRGSREEDLAPILEAASRSDVVLLSLFVRFRTGQGNLALPPLARETVSRLLTAGSRVVAVSFGNPYLLRDLPELSTYVAAYGGQDVVQTAAARALFGEAAFGGRLPVTIPGIAARGDGIQKPAVRPGEAE